MDITFFWSALCLLMKEILMLNLIILKEKNMNKTVELLWSDNKKEIKKNTSIYTDPHFQRKVFQECNFN